jgi:transposase
MNQNITVIGFDVSKKVIVTGVLLQDQDRIKESKVVPNDPKSVEQEIRRLAGMHGNLVVVYEAGPFGYDLHRQILKMGHRCAVVAPGLIPKRPTDRVKTDRRDAEKLARLYRAGELTEVRVPTQEEEAARDLVRVREDVLADQLRARNRLSKFLLRQGRAYPHKKALGTAYRAWLGTQKFEWSSLQEAFEANVRALDETTDHLASLDKKIEVMAGEKPYADLVRHLRCLKGIDTLGAITLAVETRDFNRFENAAGFMSFTGLVSSEYSSGESVYRGSITKAGNAHLRRVLVEAAWASRFKPLSSRAISIRRQNCPPGILQIARKAQERLHRKYWRLLGRGKNPGVVVTAVARELAGFVWAIGRNTQTASAMAA